MNGLLHRLAAQAMGRSNTVRSGRLPYAPRPSTAESISPDVIATSLASANERGRVQLGHASPEGAPDQREPLPELAVKPGALPLRDKRDKAFTASPDGGIPGASLSVVKGLSHPSKELPAANAMIDQTTGGAEMAFSGEPNWPASPIEPHPGTNRSGYGLDQSTAPIDDSSPPPLLPQRAPVRNTEIDGRVAGRHSGLRTAAWQGPVEETTEVHVSIGRIEVTAVHEAPTAKRQPPAASKLMTLDEYLARRRRET